MKKLLLLYSFKLAIVMNVTHGSSAPLSNNQLLDYLSYISDISTFYKCFASCLQNNNQSAATLTCCSNPLGLITWPSQMLAKQTSPDAYAQEQEDAITYQPDAILRTLTIPFTQAQAQDVAMRAAMISQLVDLLPPNSSFDAGRLTEWYITNIILPTYDVPSSTNSAELNTYALDLINYNMKYQTCFSDFIQQDGVPWPTAMEICNSTALTTLNQDLKDLTSYLQAQQNTLQNTLGYLTKQGQSLDDAITSIYFNIEGCDASSAIKCLQAVCNRAQNSPTAVAPVTNQIFYLMQEPKIYWSQKLPHGHTVCHLGNYQGHGICNNTHTNQCVHPYTPLTEKDAEKICKYSAQTQQPNKKAITWSMPGLKTLPT